MVKLIWKVLEFYHGRNFMKIEYILNDGYLQEMEENGDILVFIKPTLEEKKFIKENFDISDHDISSSLDEEELPRLDGKRNQKIINYQGRSFISSIIRIINLLITTNIRFKRLS